MRERENGDRLRGDIEAERVEEWKKGGRDRVKEERRERETVK